MTDTSSKLDQLLQLRKFARGQLLLQWSAPPEAAGKEQQLMKSLRHRVEQEVQAGPRTAEGPVTIAMDRAGESEAHVGPSVLMLRRAFKGNVARSTDLLKTWIEKHWFSFHELFEPSLRPHFAALIVDVELSSEGIFDDAQQRALIARYLNPIPGWGELADAEFRLCKAIDKRYYLNFGLSTFKTIDLQVQAAPNVLADPSAQPTLSVSVKERVKDRGLKLQIDANTKFNILNNLDPISVERSDLDRCLALIVDAVEVQLRPFLRMEK